MAGSRLILSFVFKSSLVVADILAFQNPPHRLSANRYSQWLRLVFITTNPNNHQVFYKTQYYKLQFQDS
jgi:hypothetical protein